MPDRAAIQAPAKTSLMVEEKNIYQAQSCPR